jgi:hypothetical protein
LWFFLAYKCKKTVQNQVRQYIFKCVPRRIKKFVNENSSSKLHPPKSYFSPYLIHLANCRIKIVPNDIPTNGFSILRWRTSRNTIGQWRKYIFCFKVISLAWFRTWPRKSNNNKTRYTASNLICLNHVLTCNADLKVTHGRFDCSCKWYNQPIFFL